MPELPEVEIVRLGIVPALEGKVLSNVTVHRRDLRIPIPEDLEERLEGKIVEQILRRGKYILILLKNGQGVVLHLGMSGRILIYSSGDSYERAKHDHVVLTVADGTRVVFNDPRRFGMFYLIDGDNWQTQKPFSEMAPEPLGNGFSGLVLKENFSGRKINIKAALLDQHIVTGVGNIYACEALYDAKISPMRAAGDLNDEEVERLCVAIRDVLTRAIKAGGSSLKDYQHTDGSLGYFQHAFSVYDQEGNKCKACDCDSAVQRIVQGGRSTFYCSRRQI